MSLRDDLKWRLGMFLSEHPDDTYDGYAVTTQNNGFLMLSPEESAVFYSADPNTRKCTKAIY